MYALYVQQAYKRPKLKWNIELRKILYVQAQYHIYSNALIYCLKPYVSSSVSPSLYLIWLLIMHQSILWLLICVLCGPSFASHGSLCRELRGLTCLIDVLGYNPSTIVFLTSV